MNALPRFTGTRWRTAGLLMIAALLAAAQFLLPALIPISPSAEDFSADRAWAHLMIIGESPHPPGSARHTQVRDYLIARLKDLGLTPEIQTTPLPNSEAQLENILVRIPGTASRNAVLLIAHYDSEAATPGAGDNGTGTALLLEITRALVHAAPQKNDVWVLFSDGEELGLLGATAFINREPQIAQVKVALNFDTFTLGPAFMWQTSPENGWLIRQYIAAESAPAANSWLYDLARSLPLDTDLTPFIAAGVSGYNFSTAHLYPEIQTPEDRPEIVNHSSLQHAGIQGLALVRHLADADLSVTRAPNQIYFNLWGPLMIAYPAKGSELLSMLAAGLFLAVCGLGLKTHRLSGRNLWQGVITFLLAALLAVVTSLGLWILGVLLQPAVFTPWIGPLPRHTPHDERFFMGLAVWALGIFLLVYRPALKKNSHPNLALSALGFWAALALWTGFSLPGASYLFLWPLTINLLGVAGPWLLPPGHPRLSEFITAAAAGLTLFLWIPFLILFYMITAMMAFPLLVLWVVLGLSALLPVFTLFEQKRP